MTRVEREYEQLAAHLPKTVPSILDVGCGDGGMSLMFAQNKGTKNIHLLEGDHEDLGPKRMGFRKETKPWRSVAKAVYLLKDKAPDVDIHAYFPSTPWPESVDLVMSLWSWGFHYSVYTYIDQLEKIRAPLLIDLRPRTLEKALAVIRSRGYVLRSVVDRDRKAARVYMTPAKN